MMTMMVMLMMMIYDNDGYDEYDYDKRSGLCCEDDCLV